MTLTYNIALSMLFSLVDFERSKLQAQRSGQHLERTLALMEAFGAPHKAGKMKILHIAGSKGKGSVCAMIESILRNNGIKTGFYSSPSMHRFTERIRINGIPIDENSFARLLERVWPTVVEMKRTSLLGAPTVFEILTTMAMLQFREAGVGVAVVETGLGGRLDSTNVVHPLVSVITRIGIDHADILGNSIERIAKEKAGIIKSGVPVVTGFQLPEAMAVIQEKAMEESAPLIDAEATVTEIVKPTKIKWGECVSVKTSTSPYSFRLPLLGLHQVENARIALGVIETIQRLGVEVSVGAVEKGLEYVEWPGRVELLQEASPTVIADGAHNEDSAKALVAAIERHFGSYRRILLIFGATYGHDYISVVKAFLHMTPVIITTQSRHPRSVDAKMLTSKIRSEGINVVFTAHDAKAALYHAQSVATDKDLIVACGSIFTASDIIEEMKGIDAEIYPSFTSLPNR